MPSMQKRKRGIRQKAVGLLLAAAAVLGLAPPAGAAQVTFKPMISGSGRYDSNFYRSQTEERKVYSYAVQPGVRAGIETPKARLNVDYTLEAWFYDEVDDPPPGFDKADEDNYFGHILGADLRLTPLKRLTLGVDETYFLTRMPGQADRFSDSTTRDKYSVNTLNPMVYYEFENRFGLGLQYRWTEIDYDELEVNDASEHRGIFDLFYNPTRSVTLNLDYQRWAYDQDTDLIGAQYTSDQLMFAAQKRFNYFAFDGGIGYHNRSYDDDLDDEETVSFKVSVTGQNPPPPETMRYLGREQYIRAKSHLYLAAERDLNNVGSIIDQFTADRFTLSTGHVFADKLLARLKGYYQMNDYLEEDREDDLYSVSGRLGYLFTAKLSLNLEGGIEERDSNTEGFDYENQFIALSLDFDYDVGSRRSILEEASYYR
jgi:hypothetical protein